MVISVNLYLTRGHYISDLEKSLRDIAVPIQAKDINEIYFKDRNLMYPVYKKYILRRFIYKMTEPFVK